MRIRELAQPVPASATRIWTLLRREGWPANKKGIHRVYRLEGLQVGMLLLQPAGRVEAAVIYFTA